MATNKARIMAAGPVEIPPAVLVNAALPQPHHRTKGFRLAFKDVVDGLQRVFLTKNTILTMAASGTGGMEAAVVNMFSPGDEVIVASCGAFGQRWADISKAYGLTIHQIDAEWGSAVDVKAVAEKLKAVPNAAGVLTTFNETSTGVENDIQSIGELVKSTNAVFIVDGISGVGAMPFRTDEWNVDVLVVGSQKGLMLPPGLAFVALSEKAKKRIESAKLPKFYLSFAKGLKSMTAEELPDTPFTPAVSLILQCREAIKLIEKEGLENVWKRGARMAEATRIGVKALGLKLLAPANFSNVVTAVDCRDGVVDPSKVVKGLLGRFGISIIGGQGKLKGKIFRLGHVGHVDDLDVLATMAALELVLKESGAPVKLGAGVSAVQEFLLKQGG